MPVSQPEWRPEFTADPEARKHPYDLLATLIRGTIALTFS